MQSAQQVQWTRRLGATAVAMTFALMVLGSWVKATGSGLACPDWPQCYGEWLPPFPSVENGGAWEGQPVMYTQAMVLYEWGHRLLASLLAPVLLAFAIVALRGRALHPTLRFLPSFAGIVLVAQIGIGGATVLQGNPAATTTLHLATATFFFFLVTLATAFAYLHPLAGPMTRIVNVVPAPVGVAGSLVPASPQRKRRQAVDDDAPGLSQQAHIEDPLSAADSASSGHSAANLLRPIRAATASRSSTRARSVTIAAPEPASKEAARSPFAGAISRPLQGGRPTQEALSGRPAMAIVRDFVEISKPRIILLLLIVAWAAMFVAARGIPPLAPFLAVTAAGTFSTAASGAFNNAIELERDRRMGRTANRPVASGRIARSSAVLYGAAMTFLALASLVLIGAWLATLLTAAAIGYYVVVYTVWLKPTTPQNIVIGGLAGSFPAVIGWSAMTGGLAAPAFVIAALVFLWTPAHFWALALLYKKDYAAADYPMYPNTAGEHRTRRMILVYSALTVLASLALVYPLADAGLVYLAATIVFGLALIVRAGRLETNPHPKAYRGFFLYTIQYLGFLLVALMVDQVLHRPLV